MKLLRFSPARILLFLLTLSYFNTYPQTKIIRKADSLLINFQGKIIFKGVLSGQKSALFSVLQQEQLINNASFQVITITAGLSKSFRLDGKIFASKKSIAVESDPSDSGLKFVRHSVGPSQNLRNNAVYDKTQDWLLSIDSFYPKIKIESTVSDIESNGFQLTATGWELVIRFRPDYYKKHRGLHYFNSTEHRLVSKPIVGWCSWYAYFDKVTEENIEGLVKVASRKLKPYGLEYIQIDDGYQQIPIGLPDHWLTSNSKFPKGMRQLANYIRQEGMIPGIWTNVAFADSIAAAKDSRLFIRDKNGRPVRGNWVDYVMDGSNPESIAKFIEPVYQGLKSQGWNYFKLDALRHLKYEGYNSHSDYFTGKKIDRNAAFRNVVKSVRSSIGSDVPLMACWGIRPELVGLVDACRIGNDGYSYAGLAQFNSYNNIIWQNDPDHIELSDKEAYRSCTATSLTGSLFMLTDKPEKYDSPLVEAALRSMPVLYTQPGQVYDVDPSRSSVISLADVEMSGSGPRPFDASTTTTTGLFALEISRPFENWVALGRLDERDKIIYFKDLGLNEQKEYLVFEFWSKEFKGLFSKFYEAGSIDKRFNCQVLCFRERTDHPQILATNRHITCGGVDLLNVKWDKNSLTGQSQIVLSENYILFVYEPGLGTEPIITCDQAEVIRSNKEGSVRTIELKPKTSNIINWSVKY